MPAIPWRIRTTSLEGVLSVHGAHGLGQMLFFRETA